MSLEFYDFENTLLFKLNKENFDIYLKTLKNNIKISNTQILDPITKMTSNNLYLYTLCFEKLQKLQKLQNHDFEIKPIFKFNDADLLYLRFLIQTVNNVDHIINPSILTYLIRSNSDNYKLYVKFVNITDSLEEFEKNSLIKNPRKKKKLNQLCGINYFKFTH